MGPTFTVPTRGAFDVRAVFAAARRGLAADVDPLDPDWDYDALMPLALDEARTSLRL